MEGSETLFVKACSWSAVAMSRKGSRLELCSEPEDKLSVLRAGEGEHEEG